MSWRTYLVALILGFAVAIGYQAMFDGVRYPYNSDSAAYIEQARNLNSGIGIYATPFEPYPVDTDLVRPNLFPPGYVLAIAMVSRLGCAEHMIAPWINRLAAALLPAAMVYGFAVRLGAAPLLVAVGLVILSPGVLTWQYSANSDAGFLLLVMLSIGQLVRAPHSVGALLTSGALAGLAYCFRNVGAALLLAVPAALMACSLLRLEPGRAYFSSGLVWGSGVALFVVPLIGYNIITFGAVQPYDMPPSTVGLLTNAGTFLAAQVADVFGFRLLSLGAQDARILALLLVGVIGFVFAMAYTWRCLKQQDKAMVILLACYVLAGAAVVVLARTRYQWGEMIGIRHTMQYSWAIILILAAAVNSLRLGSSPKRRTLIMPLQLLCCLCSGALMSTGPRHDLAM